RHAFEFAQKRALALKRAAVNNFYRAQRAGDGPGQPNLAISAAPDHAQKFVIRNDGNLSGNFDGRDFTQGWRPRQFLEGRAPPRLIQKVTTEPDPPSFPAL